MKPQNRKSSEAPRTLGSDIDRWAAKRFRPATATPETQRPGGHDTPTLVIGGLALVGTVAAAGVLLANPDMLAGKTPGENREGEMNRHITSVTFESGANVRETPIKGDADVSNLLAKLEQPVVMTTPDGVLTYEDDNGTWFSVSAESLAEQVTDEDTKAKILKDEDGNVWVNDDKAEPTYETE